VNSAAGIEMAAAKKRKRCRYFIFKKLIFNCLGGLGDLEG